MSYKQYKQGIAPIILVVVIAVAVLGAGTGGYVLTRESSDEKNGSQQNIPVRETPEKAETVQPKNSRAESKANQQQSEVQKTETEDVSAPVPYRNPFRQTTGSSNPAPPPESDKPAAETGDQSGPGLGDLIRHIAGLNAREVNKQKKTWAGHAFDAAILATRQYKTDGNDAIAFSESGFYAPSYSLPRTTLRDVNLNQKVKVKIIGTLEGALESQDESCTGYCVTTERYHFSEFATYVSDEDDNRQALRLLGTRHNIVRGNDKDKYQFTELVIENTGDEIIVTDSTGFTISYSTDFKYVTTGGHTEPNEGSGNYDVLNKDQKWFLDINCHVNGVGFCKMDIQDIQATYP